MSGCNCGSSCSCGSDCKCGKKYPDLSVYETTTRTAQTIIAGVAPVKMFYEGSEMNYGAENDDKHASGCKCGDGCSCDPCTC